MRRPGGEIASRPLHFFWMVDCSGSMSRSGKMDALNEAIRQTIPALRSVASENPHAKVFVKVLKFSHGAEWHLPTLTPVEDFEWWDLKADHLSSTTAAADVIFLLDTSGSMGGEIDAVKHSCDAFADEIGKRGASVRLGLISFAIGGHRRMGRPQGNYSVHQLSTYTLGVWPLSTPAEFKRNVRDLRLGMFGGRGCYLAKSDTVDIFPHVLKAFDGSSERAKRLVIVSDEIGSSAGLEQILSMLDQNHVRTHVLGVPGPTRAHEQLASRTGGQFWSIRELRGRQDFSQVFSEIGGTVGDEIIQQLDNGTLSKGTDLGAGLRLLSNDLTIPPMSDRAMPPVIVLISDGRPTDDFESALGHLLQLPWGRRAVRLGVGIGSDADLGVLSRFIHNSEIPPLVANNPTQLVKFIRWASTTAVKAVSAPHSVASGQPRSNVPLPPIVKHPSEIEAEIVW